MRLHAVHVLRRVGHAALVLLAAYLGTFLLLTVLPSDPVSLLLASRETANTSPQAVAELRAFYGFDDPLPIRFVQQLHEVLTGNLGTSLNTGLPVSQRLAETLPATLRLAAVALVIALVLAVAVAVLATRSPRSGVRAFVRGLPPLANSVPLFWVALLFVQWFSFQLGWLPIVAVRETPVSLGIAAFALAIPASAPIAQVLVRNVEEVYAAPFVTVLRSSGVSERHLLVRDVLPNVIPRALTITGLTVGGLLTGSVVTETVFNRAGFGSLLQQAVTEQDVSVVQGAVLVAAVVYVGVNLVVDVAVPFIDPRVRAGVAA